MGSGAETRSNRRAYWTHQAILVLLAMSLCGTACVWKKQMTGELALVTLKEIPVPEAAKQRGAEQMQGRDGGGGFLVFNVEANEAKPIYQAKEASASSAYYLEGSVLTKFYPLVLLFSWSESTRFFARRVDLPPRAPKPSANRSSGASDAERAEPRVGDTEPRTKATDAQ